MNGASPGVRGNRLEPAGSRKSCTGSQASQLGGREAQSSFQREMRGSQHEKCRMIPQAKSLPHPSMVRSSIPFVTHPRNLGSRRGGAEICRKAHTAFQQQQGMQELSCRREQTQRWEPRSSSRLLFPLIATLVLRS